MREQGRSKTGIASLPHVNLASMSVPRSTGERQEHLDAIVSFAGARQRRRLFRGLDILTQFRGRQATSRKDAASSSTRSSCS